MIQYILRKYESQCKSHTFFSVSGVSLLFFNFRAILFFIKNQIYINKEVQTLKGRKLCGKEQVCDSSGSSHLLPAFLCAPPSFPHTPPLFLFFSSPILLCSYTYFSCLVKCIQTRPVAYQPYPSVLLLMNQSHWRKNNNTIIVTASTSSTMGSILNKGMISGSFRKICMLILGRKKKVAPKIACTETMETTITVVTCQNMN